MLRIFTLFLLVLIGSSAVAQINFGNPTRPFGSNTSYSYGIMPTNLPTGGTYGASQDAAEAYNTWKTNYVEQCSGTPVKYRVKFDTPALTVSEGIAYGMLLSAYAGDKPVFDGLWLYYKSFLTSNGLMHWRISGCSSVDGSGGATDADLDAALALRVAMVQWPSEPMYSPDLTTLVQKIRLHEIQTASEQGAYQTNNGDQWGASNDCRNPSYQSPAYYKVFANIEPSFTSFWTSAENASYTLLNANVNSSTGLASNWCNSAGAPNTCNGPNEYGWDACRFPWRMATDAIWWNTTNSITRCNALASYVQTTGVPNLKGPVPLAGGAGMYHSPAFVSTWACGLMGASTNYQSTLNLAYLESVAVQDNLPYYFGNTLRAIMLFQMTGNFWNPLTTSGCSSLALSIGSDATICNGTSITRTATASGGTAPYTYTWNNNLGAGATKTLTPTSTTTYVVTVSDNAGCTKTSSLIVTVSSLTANAGPDQTLCLGSSTTLSASGGTSYTWSSGATTASISVIPQTTTSYTVTVSNSNGCTATDNVNINVSPLPTINAGSDATICDGTTITRTAIASGGTAPYTYTWNNNLGAGATKTLTPTSTTTYVITVSDNAGCTKTSSFIVTVSSLTTNAGPDQTLCLGSSTTLFASGGTSYTWSSGATTASISVNPQTTTSYTVTVSNSNGCTATDNVNINVSPLPTINAGSDATICDGTTITRTAIASGGTAPYSYTWNNNLGSGATKTLTPTSTTTYVVTVNDNAGCTNISSFNIVVNSSPIVNAGENFAVCSGASVIITASGADTYLWSDGSTNSYLIVNPASTINYTVTGTNANGCTSSDNIMVTVDPTPVISAGPDQSILIGQSANLTATGNATTYVWNNGEPTSSITVSPDSTTTYTVIGTSVAGCQTSDIVTVYVNTLLLETGNNEDICVGSSITRSVNTVGGVAPYNYMWNNGLGAGDTKVLNPATTTTYIITVTDNNNTTSTGSFTINVNQIPIVSDVDNVTICELSSTTLTASGAFEYFWNTNSTSNSINVNPSNTTTYSVTGYSQAGCSASSSVTVNVNPGFTINNGGNAEICQGDSLLRTVSSTGGTAPFNYLWDNNLGTGATKVLNPTNTTTYITTATDANGCTSISSFDITVNPNPNVTAGPDVVLLLGQSTTIFATGANTYVWNNGETTSSITVSPTTNTTYIVTGTNIQGCISTDNVSIFINNLVVNAGNNATICQGNSFVRTVSSTGGNAPYNYAWSNNLGSGATKTLNPSSSTTYTITATDVNGFTAVSSFEVIVNPIPTVNAGINVTIQLGESATLTAIGAATYLWNNGVTTGVNTISPSATTIYTVTGTSTFGCSATDEVVVTVSNLELNAGADNVICQGGSVLRTLSTTGGIAPFSYTWSNGASGSTQTLNPSSTTTYTITVTDANNSSDTDQFVISVNTSPIASANANQSICAGSSVVISASATNGTSPYTFTWINGLGLGSSKTVNPSISTTYIVTVSDVNTCTSTAATVITVSTVPTATITATTSTISYSVYKEPTTIINGFWNTNGTLTEVTTSTPYQGTKHYQYTPNGSATYANFGLNLSNWGSTGKNFSGYASMLIAYRGMGGTNVVSMTLKNSAASPNQSNKVTIGGATTSYSLVNIPMTQFTAGNNFNLANVTEIMIEINDGTSTSTTALYIDNIELLGNPTTLSPPYSNCGGTGMTLTASGGNTYAWSNGSSTANININPTTTTTYVVTVSNGLSCNSTQSATVTGGAGLTIPTNIAATDGTLTNSVAVTWAALACNYYRVYRNTTNSTSSATALGTWTTNSTYTDNTAAAGTLYYYWVVASLSSTGSNPSGYSTNNSGYAILAAPANVTATDGTSTSNVNISCTAVSGNYFRVYRNNTNSTTGATALGNWSTSSSYIDNTAVAGTTYFYWMVASKYSTGTPSSAYSTSNTGFRGVVPTVPAAVAASDGTFNNKVRITWTGKAGAFFKVYRNTTNSSTGATELSAWITALTYDNTTVSQGTIYYYFVRSASSNTGSNITAFSTSNSGYSSASGSARPNTKDAVNPKIHIYPNPSAADIIVTWDGLENDFVELIVSDANGNIVFNRSIHAIAGQNSFTILKSEIPEGVFYVKIINVNGFLYKSRPIILMDK